MRDDAKAPARTESLCGRASTTTCFKTVKKQDRYMHYTYTPPRIPICRASVAPYQTNKAHNRTPRGATRALPTAVCFAADAGTKCARFCSIAASRKISTAFEVRSERSDASAQASGES